MENKRHQASADVTVIKALCLLLLAANIAALMAPLHWLFDIFVNFKIQYFTGALILTGLALLYRMRIWGAGMALLAALLFAQITTVYDKPFASAPPQQANFRIAQFNKLFDNHDYERIGVWLRDPGSDFDVVIVNESLWDAIAPLQEFRDIYPHQYPNDASERFGDISVLSRHPVAVRPLPMRWQGRLFNVTEITLRRPGFPPLTILAHHAQTPTSAAGAASREFELTRFAKFALRHGEGPLIMIGDWNITPWSPLFARIREISGLRYRQSSLFPVTTWPAQMPLNILKIPIDQFLFDDSLTLVASRRGPASGSDHHSLIAEFYIPPRQ